MLSLTCVSSAQLNGNYTIDPPVPVRETTPRGPQPWPRSASGVSGLWFSPWPSTTFNETVVISPITGTSALATVTFQAKGARAVLDAGAAQDALTLNTTCRYLIFDNIEVKNFTRYGLSLAGGSSTRAAFFCTFKKCKFDAPATTSTSVRAVQAYYSADCTFEDCVFAGGGHVFYSQQMNRMVLRACEFDGKLLAARVLAPYNSNDSDNLYENCFFHSCGAAAGESGINLGQFGNMLWHNTVLVNTSKSGVILGGCCNWSRANSFRNNIVVNMGTGVCITYGTTDGTLDFNDADYNSYHAPNGLACELEKGTAFTKGTLAQWKAYLAANPGMIPGNGGKSWDQNSIEVDPMLTSMTAPYDIHLQSSSPCVNAGTTTYIAGPWISYPAYKPSTDFEGDPRPEFPRRYRSRRGGRPSDRLRKRYAWHELRLEFAWQSRQRFALPVLGSSLGSGPIPVDSRYLFLTLDAILWASVHGLLPSTFADYSGNLDASGQATASINIPSIPLLTGLRIYTAFVTIKAGEPSNIKTISNTFVFTIIQ